MFTLELATYIAMRAVGPAARSRLGDWPRRPGGRFDGWRIPSRSVPVTYMCNLSGYSRSRRRPSLSASLGVPSTARRGTDLTVQELVTARAQLPVSLASSMPAISYIGAGAPLRSPGAASSLSGQNPQLGTAAGAMTESPSITATGSGRPAERGHRVCRGAAIRSSSCRPMAHKLGPDNLHRHERRQDREYCDDGDLQGNQCRHAHLRYGDDIRERTGHRHGRQPRTPPRT